MRDALHYRTRGYAVAYYSRAMLNIRNDTPLS